MAPEQEQVAITAAQQRLPPSRIGANRTRHDFRRTARWWELEARRGYDSSGRSLSYAVNMRFAAELAGIYGEGTWLELKARRERAEQEVRAITTKKKRKGAGDSK